MGERDAIADSDQGRSFQAFWDFLMSQDRQEELSRLLDRVLALEPIAEMAPDPRLRRIHYDWLEAGEHTQRTVALLSRQLRRFLDDQAWLENRRIMEILRGIEARALALRDTPPRWMFMEMEESGAVIDLPLERPLFSPPRRISLADLDIREGEAEVDTALLYAQVVVDRAELTQIIERELRRHSPLRLAEIIERHPLRHGLAELVTYLQLAVDRPGTVVDEERRDRVGWQGDDGRERWAILPRIVLVREGAAPVRPAVGKSGSDNG